MTTVAVTNKSGKTRYYAQVTDSDKKTVTDSKGNAVTTEITARDSKKAPPSTGKTVKGADNTGKFETTANTSDSTAVATTKGTTAATSAAQSTTNQPTSTNP